MDREKEMSNPSLSCFGIDQDGKSIMMPGVSVQRYHTLNTACGNLTLDTILTLDMIETDNT